MKRSREPRNEGPRPAADPGPRPPTAREQTLREALREALLRGPATLSELSVDVRAAEKQLVEHLEHLARSLPHQGLALEVEGPRCLACGFGFPDRARMTRPSRCPACKSNRITRPRFAIVPCSSLA